jgi:hypothetical protein
MADVVELDCAALALLDPDAISALPWEISREIGPGKGTEQLESTIMLGRPVTMLKVRSSE